MFYILVYHIYQLLIESICNYEYILLKRTNNHKNDTI